MLNRVIFLPAAFFLTSLAPLRAAVEDSVKALAATGREGAGNEAAAAAWKAVVSEGPRALPALLVATGTRGVVVDNWLRLAADAITDAITDAALHAKQPLPLAEVEAFLKDTKNAAPARQLAFDLIAKADAALADKIEPGLVNDPVQELRRGAVARLITAAKSKAGDDAKFAYLHALDAVRDEDQTNEIAGALKKLGVTVDLPKHFGFLMKWNVIGPFDNTDRKGFDTVFPPEREVKPDTEYNGKTGKVKWKTVESKDERGKFDFNKPFGSLKGVTGYGVTTFDSATEREAELRLGCKNGWKVWLNGELLFSRDEYHRGAQMDQYKMKCRLKKGANTILVKCCQDEQKEEWTVEWEFQLRVCDSTGTAILSTK
jgi:hypothetical protein